MKKEEFKKGEIIIYKTSNNEVALDVRMEKETVWLNLSQMSKLFGRDKSVISRHIKNIFDDKELNYKSVVAIFATTGSDGKTYQIEYYNLDAIISIGYRVKSRQGVSFRIWATNKLKKYLIKGYAINAKRLSVSREKFIELQRAISFLQKKSKNKLLTGQEQEILNLLSRYSKSLSFLEKYDKSKLETVRTGKPRFLLNYESCLKIIGSIKKDLAARGEASEMFGQEVNNKFESAIKSIYQTFDEKELYKSIEEKAANLLYLTIKDHPFVDGNKRTASFLFVYFLERNNYLYRDNGEIKIDDNTLVTLALLISVSDPKEKETMIKLITNLIK